MHPLRRLSYHRLWALLCISALLIVVPALLWRGLVTLPHRYDDLDEHGVAVRLQVTRCGVGVGGDSRGQGCRVRLHYGSYTSSWKEGDVRPMMSPDGTVGGVVDPRDPGIHATAYAVSRRSGAGFRGTEVFVALLCTLVAGVGALLSIAMERRRDVSPT